jgi:uncharacterized Zn-binding protein involved in type VI secretion
MGQPAARLTDMHTCPLSTGPVPHVGGPITAPGCPTVLIGALPAARITDIAICVGPPDVIVKGSPTVLIGGVLAARIADLSRPWRRHHHRRPHGTDRALGSLGLAHPSRSACGNAIPGFSLPMSDCRVALTRGSLPTQRVKRARPTGAAHDRIHATPPSSTVHAMSVSSLWSRRSPLQPWAAKIRATL